MHCDRPLLLYLIAPSVPYLGQDLERAVGQEAHGTLVMKVLSGLAFETVQCTGWANFRDLPN